MKNRFLLVAAFFPLLVFANFQYEDYIIERMDIYRYSSFDVADRFYSCSPSSEDDLLSTLSSSIFAMKFNTVNYQISVPSTILSSSGSSTQPRWNIYARYYDGSSYSSVCLSPFILPRLSSFYRSIPTLFQLGYRGPGFSFISNSGNNYCINVNYPLLVSDVLSSTNTVFRQALLSSLSALQTSISNIQVDLGQFQDDYSFVNASHFNISNVIDYAAADSVIPSRLATSLKSSARDPYNFDNIKPILDSYYFAQWLPLAFSDSDLASPLHNDSRVKKGLQNLGDSFAAGGAYHYTTPMTNELRRLSTNVVAEVHAALSNNTEQIKDRLAHMFDNPSDTSTVGGGVANISRAAGVLAGAVNNNRVMVSIDNATPVSVLLDGPINLDQSQLTQLSTPLAGLERWIDTWYQDWYDFFSPNVSGYNWIHFFDMVSSFKDVNHTDLVSLQSCVSNLLLSLRGDITNSVVSTNGYLLLSDYADYIHSGGLDTLLDVMDDDSYSDLKAEIDSLYHSDTSEGYGRWWRYFTGLSTVQANSIFKLSNIFQVHEKLLKDLKRDNSDLDVQDASDSSVFRKLLYTIPSDEDTFNKLSQLTNSIDQSGMARVQQLIPDLTNRFSVAASLYDKDFVLPSEISWELIPADSSINSPARIVTIRPSEHYRLFQLLHFGLAFSYCLVNIILFPKFLLFLVRLFDRVWNKSEKLIYNSTQS